MKRTFFTLLGMAVLLNFSIAQNRFSIEFSGGAALPIGGFGKNNPEESMLYWEELAPTVPLGLKKQMSGGMAQTGFFFELSGNYQLSTFLKLSLQIGQQTHAVSTSATESFISEIFQREHSFSHTDYRMGYIIPSLEVNRSMHNWQFGLGIGYGFSRMNYPKYSASYVFDVENNFISEWKSWGEMKDLESGLFKTHFTINRVLSEHIYLGLKITFLQSKYNFTQSTRWVPATNFRPDFDDTLNVQSINMGVSFCYHF